MISKSAVTLKCLNKSIFLFRLLLLLIIFTSVFYILIKNDFSNISFIFLLFFILLYKFYLKTLKTVNNV